MKNEFDIQEYYQLIVNCNIWIGETIEFTANYFRLFDLKGKEM